jgi:hypothetical protein
MSRADFETALDRWANRALFEKVDGHWTPRFMVR